MAEITNYTGNAALGSGSNADISVISPERRSSTVMRDTYDKIMQQNHENNVMMFKQKVQDRDKLYQALADGQVQVGDMNPEDRKWYEDHKDAKNKAYDDMSQHGGINNKEAYEKYTRATTDLKEAATHIQARKIGFDQWNAAIAKEPIKSKKDEMQAQFDKVKAKGAGALVEPYQRALDWDGEKFDLIGNKGAVVGGSGNSATQTSTVTKTKQGEAPVTTVTTKNTPVKGKPNQSVTTTGNTSAGKAAASPQDGGIVYRGGIPFAVSHQYVDFNVIKNNYRENWRESNGEGAELQQKFYDQFTDPNVIGHPQIMETYDHMIKKADEYNKSRGFVPSATGEMSKEDLDNGAADVQKLRAAIAAPIDPKTGKRNINMTVPELSAYANLANNSTGYSSSSETPMTELAKLTQSGEKIRGELKLKAQEAASKDALRKAQILKIHKAIEGKSPEQEKQEFNKYYNGNASSLLTPTEKKTSLAGDKGAIDANNGTIAYKDSRPVYTQDVNGNPKLLRPIGSSEIYDVTDADGLRTAKSRVVGYSGGYYQTQFYNKGTGQTVSLETIQKRFKEARAAHPKVTELEAFEAMNQGGISFRMIGEGGASTNIDDNGDNLRKLNDKFQKRKDQDTPIADDGDLFPETSAQQTP